MMSFIFHLHVIFLVVGAAVGTVISAVHQTNGEQLHEKMSDNNGQDDQIGTELISGTEMQSHYDNQVIYITLPKYEAYYMSVQSSQEIVFVTANRNELTSMPEAKWYVRVTSDGYATLENGKYKNYYLYANTSDYGHGGYSRIQYSTQPSSNDWLQFDIIQYSNVVRFVKGISFLTMCCEYRARMDTVYYPDEAQYYIYQPPASNRLATVALIDNSASVLNVNYTYSVQIGLETTSGYLVSEIVIAEMGLEIKGAFSIGLSFSTMWSSFSEATYSKVTTQTKTVYVAAGEKIKILQLAGKYGAFMVNADYFVVKDMIKEVETSKLEIEEHAHGKFLPE